MHKTKILVICRHAEILATIIRLLNNNPEWEATGAITDEEALAAFTGQPYKLVLLGSGIEPASEAHLSTAFKTINPAVLIVPHYGGGSGLLFAEVYEAIGAV